MSRQLNALMQNLIRKMPKHSKRMPEMQLIEKPYQNVYSNERTVVSLDSVVIKKIAFTSSDRHLAAI